MKVLLLGDFPKNNNIQTGVQGVLVNLLQGLIRQPNVDVIAVALRKTEYLKQYEDACRSYVLDLRSTLMRTKSAFRDIVEQEEPDIIHLQGVVPGVLLFDDSYQDRFVVTQHAILREERKWQVSFLRKLKFRAKEKMEARYLSRIRNIIFISRYNQEVFQRKVGTVQDANFGYIPNPIHTTYVSHRSEYVALQNNHLYCVGEVKKRKGLHVLLQAMKRLEEKGTSCTLHVIGGFKEKSYERNIHELIKKLGIEKSVLFCGWMTPEEIAAYARAIPTYVLPSFQETLPLGVAEAMAMSKLVVASDVGGVSEMITDKESGFLFPAGDVQALTQVLSTVLGKEDDFIHVSDRAQLQSERYRSETVILETVKYYESLIKNKN